MLSTDWWATDRTTKPPQIILISDEERRVSVGLTSAIVSGETIDGGSLAAVIYNYRTNLALDPSPLVGNPSYNSTSKVASAKIDASKLPRNDPCALVFSFTVNTSVGPETRSAFVILMVDV